MTGGGGESVAGENFRTLYNLVIFLARLLVMMMVMVMVMLMVMVVMVMMMMVMMRVVEEKVWQGRTSERFTTLSSSLPGAR